MKLGAFSVSLTVKNIQKSKDFYEKLGFESKSGIMDGNWAIMTKGEVVIGLFEGMFEKNILTFNPGWDQNAKPLDDFDDVRDIQKKLKSKGIKFEVEADEETEGSAHFIIHDPDGNPIMFDQHR